MSDPTSQPLHLVRARDDELPGWEPQTDDIAPGGGVCGLCGGPLVRNPHPDAGKPEMLSEVGYVWVCPPCTTKAMSGWAARYHEAERKAARYREALMALSKYDDDLRASNWPGLANIVKYALAAENSGGRS